MVHQARGSREEGMDEKEGTIRSHSRTASDGEAASDGIQEENCTELALVKVSLNLPLDLFRAVAAVADRRNVTKTEVIRRAVSMEVFFEEVREAEHGHLELFTRRQGLLQQVVFPWLQ